MEELDIVNLNNGNVLLLMLFQDNQEQGKFILINGGAALLCQPGDLLVIYVYEQSDRTDRIDIRQNYHTARFLVVDKQNKTKYFLVQTITYYEDEKKFNFI